VKKSSANPRAAEKLGKLRSICLELPEAEESDRGGLPSFQVAGREFAVVKEKGGRLVASVLLAREGETRREAEWVSISLGGKVDWVEVRDLVMMGYCGVAPRRMLQALDRATALTPPPGGSR